MRKAQEDLRSAPFCVVQAQAQMQHEVDENTSAKKPRVVWSVEMHQQFVNAVNSLGIDSKPPLWANRLPSQCSHCLCPVPFDMPAIAAFTASADNSASIPVRGC